ncbi:MAG TPA: helix-turn-helix transcriptional regulator [Solirubrobacteraceae bacterium]|nr:helix-turn-helix transcriptional regulator [Solirubrobacteraceae bacterium]
MGDAIRRLGELGSPAGIVARAVQELGINSQFDRLLLSEITDDYLAPLALWERESERSAPPELTVALHYPLVEHELVKSRAVTALLVTDTTSRTDRRLQERFAWDSYVAGTVVVEGKVIGLVHADAAVSGRALDEVDREIILLACSGLSEVFERASLRETLERHRAEMQTAANWLSGRLRTTTVDARAAAVVGSVGVDHVAVDTLTPREREVLALMARGKTNPQIALSLAIQQGTVKYHVKNLLRKLGARSRADAVARFARVTGATPR